MAGELTATAGRRTVSPEQAEITRLRAELSPSKIEVAILMALGHPEKAAVSRGTSVGRTLRKRLRKVCFYPSEADSVPSVRMLLGHGYNIVGVFMLG